jgi:hypothetical protein
VRYRPAFDDLVIQNQGVLRLPDAVVPLEVIGPASLLSLERAWARWAENWKTSKSEILISRDPAEGFDEEWARIEPMSLQFHRAHRVLGSSEKQAARMELVVTHYDNSVEPDATATGALIDPILRRNRCSAEVEALQHDSGAWQLDVRLLIPPRRRSVSQAVQIGAEVAALIDAASAGLLTRDTVPALLRGSQAHALLGQPEASWLEAKRAPYPLRTDAERLELAKDVAAFANSPAGGLIVLGLGTKRTPDGDVIRSLHPFPLADTRLQSYRAAVARYVFPAPVGLAIEKIAAGPTEGYVLIDVPPQPEELRPFLVAGAVVEGAFSGSHVGLFYRHGEDNSPASVAAIHGLLLAGRAALAGSPNEVGTPPFGGEL